MESIHIKPWTVAYSGNVTTPPVGDSVGMALIGGCVAGATLVGVEITAESVGDSVTNETVGAGLDEITVGAMLGSPEEFNEVTGEFVSLDDGPAFSPSKNTANVNDANWSSVLLR